MPISLIDSVSDNEVPLPPLTRNVDAFDQTEATSQNPSSERRITRSQSHSVAVRSSLDRQDEPAPNDASVPQKSKQTLSVLTSVGSAGSTPIEEDTTSFAPSPLPVPLRNPPATLPTPVPNLTKKSRGRRVPTVESREQANDDSSTSHRAHICTVQGCGKAFHRGEHLKRHIRSIHTHEKPFKCAHPNCPKLFNRHDNLLQHMKVHKDISSTPSEKPIPKPRPKRIRTPPSSASSDDESNIPPPPLKKARTIAIAQSSPDPSPSPPTPSAPPELASQIYIRQVASRMPQSIYGNPYLNSNLHPSYFMAMYNNLRSSTPSPPLSSADDRDASGEYYSADLAVSSVRTEIPYHQPAVMMDRKGRKEEY